jgi:hypothetical protein
MTHLQLADLVKSVSICTANLLGTGSSSDTVASRAGLPCGVSCCIILVKEATNSVRSLGTYILSAALITRSSLHAYAFQHNTHTRAASILCPS